MKLELNSVYPRENFAALDHLVNNHRLKSVVIDLSQIPFLQSKYQYM